MPQQNLGLNPFAYIQRPGYEPYIPGARQSYENLSTLGRVEVLGEKRDAQAAAQQKAAADQLLQETMARFPDDPEQGVRELRLRGFAKEANEWEKHVEDFKKKKLETIKADLENQRLRGQIADDEAKRVQAALDANSPDKMFTFYAAATTPEEREGAKALTRLKFGAKADPIIAQMDAMTPEFAGRVVMGPEKVGIDVDRDLAREQAAQIASDAQAVTMRGQDVSAATQRRGQDVSAATSRRGQDLTDARAGKSGPDGGVKLSATAIDKVAAIDQAAGMIADIERLLPSMTRSIGAIDGRWLKVKIASGAKVSPGEAEFDTQITALKNAVIKATTGAAMSEPEAQRIMGQIPDLTNNETVFKSRLATTLRNLELLKKRTIELSGGTVGPAPAKALTAEELIKKYGGG